MPSSLPRRPPPAALSRWRSARSKNALLDVKAKALGVPATTARRQDSRSRAGLLVALRDLAHQSPRLVQASITDLDGVKAIGCGARKTFTALKTNIFVYTDGKPQGWRPGFGAPFEPEINVDRKVLSNLCMHLEAIRDGAGPDVDLLLDLNFNAKTEGYLKILRAIKDMDMFWVEIDSFNPQALGYIAPPGRIRFRPARRCWACAIPALFLRTGDGRRHHRYPWNGVADEDRRCRRSLRGERGVA